MEIIQKKKLPNSNPKNTIIKEQTQNRKPTFKNSQSNPSRLFFFSNSKKIKIFLKEKKNNNSFTEKTKKIMLSKRISCEEMTSENKTEMNIITSNDQMDSNEDESEKEISSKDYKNFLVYVNL